DEATRCCCDPVEAAVGSFGAMSEQSVSEPPERKSRQADRDQDQEQLAERLVRDRLQRALLVRRLPAGAEGELDREYADDRVDQAPRNEPRASQPIEPAAPRDLLPSDPRAAYRPRLGRRAPISYLLSAEHEARTSSCRSRIRAQHRPLATTGLRRVPEAWECGRWEVAHRRKAPASVDRLPGREHPRRLRLCHL